MLLYILYQIKHFFYNLYKDIKGIKIKKTIKYTKFKSVQFEEKIIIDFDDKMLEKNTTPFYLKSPSFLLIERHKIDIFNNLVEIVKDYDFQIKIGIEIEFYTKNPPSNSVKEMGNNQHEIQTKTFTDLQLLVEHFNEIRKIEADFTALPDENDCSSALQINLSLEKNGMNLFARENENETQLLLNCLAGLLKNINNNLLLYIKDENSLKRFNLERNRKIHSLNKYPAPTFISWGINNRSAAIRIPTPKDLKNYKENDKKERRIEFRIPSADADIYLVMIGILSSIIEGIDNNLLPHIEKTSFNVLEKNDGLIQIIDSILDANDRFHINEDVIFY
jgi:glutamine synthetase